MDRLDIPHESEPEPEPEPEPVQMNRTGDGVIEVNEQNSEMGRTGSQGNFNMLDFLMHPTSC